MAAWPRRELVTKQRPDDNSPGVAQKPPEKQSRWQQLMSTFREYGLVFVGYYATVWLCGFGVCWGGMTACAIDGIAILKYVGADMIMDTSSLSPRLINALIAAEINDVRLPE